MVTREELHCRKIECRGFRRSDGLWDVDARLTDAKTYPYSVGDRGVVPADEPVHDMSLHLTLDADLVIRDVTATMDSTPYAICPGAATGLAPLIGMRIRSGWLLEARERLTTHERCTHLFELLGPMATTAYQTLAIARPDPRENPAKINTCFAYSSDREVVHKAWPGRYTGPAGDARPIA